MRKTKARNGKVRPVGELSAGMRLWLERATLLGVFGGLLMPLVFIRDLAYPFVFPKMLFFQILVGLTFPAWVTLALRDKQCRPTPSRLLAGVIGWLLVLSLTTGFSACHWRSFFGTQERMTGLFSLLHFFAWYLMTASMLKSSRDWRRLLEFQVLVGFVAAWAVLILPMHALIPSAPESGPGARLSGLFGNPIFAASYQNFNIFFCILLWQGASRPKRIWYALVLLFSLFTLVAAGSRGPLLGAVVGLGVTSFAFGLWNGRRRMIKGTTVAVALVVATYALLLAFFVHSMQSAFWATHGNLARFFQFNVDLGRTWLWSTAWSGFVARPIFGWGLLNYEVIFDVFYQPKFHTLGINDEAHNWLLGVLSETGIVGLLVVFAMWASFLCDRRRI